MSGRVKWLVGTSRGRNFLLFAAMMFSATAMTVQAWRNGPTADETAHLAAGVATMRTGDCSYYRVNPPLHKLISAAPLDWLAPPSLKEVYKTATVPGQRYEFWLGKSFIEDNKDNYRIYFRIARFVRIPFVLLGGILIFLTLKELDPTAGLIASVAWFTSPLVLGHGWIVMPDAVSGTAMALLLVTWFSWLKRPSKIRLFFVGIAWGCCLSTKFTFCPLAVVWPLIGTVCVWRNRHLTRVSIPQIWLGYFASLFVALAIVSVTYNGDGMWTPLGKHNFQSSSLEKFNDNSGSTINQATGWLISPFPKQYLLGIDEQTLDLEMGFPSYLLGRWYPDGIWYYYLIGYPIKEHPVVVLGIFLSLTTQVLGRYKFDTITEASLHLRMFAIVAVFFFCLLSLNHKMALNVRYLFPALPAVYGIVGVACSCFINSVFPKTSNGWETGLIALMFLCMSTSFPNYFSYASPFVGGANRNPSALHDTNFDAGQDLWRIEDYLAKHLDKPNDTFSCCCSRVPEEATFGIELPSIEKIKRIIREKEIGHCKPIALSDCEFQIIVSREIGTPSNWTLILGNGSTELSVAVTELLTHPPDDKISATTWIYRTVKDAQRFEDASSR